MKSQKNPGPYPVRVGGQGQGSAHEEVALTTPATPATPEPLVPRERTNTVEEVQLESNWIRWEDGQWKNDEKMGCGNVATRYQQQKEF